MDGTLDPQHWELGTTVPPPGFVVDLRFVWFRGVAHNWGWVGWVERYVDG